MCDPITLGLIGAGLSVAGTGAGMVSQNNQLKQQDQIAAQGIMRQTQLNQQAGQAVSKLTQKIASSNPQAATAAENAKYAAALQAAAPQIDSTNKNMAGASARYNADATQDQQTVANYGTQQANIDAQVDAPQLQRLNEGEEIGDTAGTLGELANTSQQDSTLTGLQVQSTQQNPWLEAASGVMKGAGAGLSAYSGYQQGGVNSMVNQDNAAAAASGYNPAASSLYSAGGGYTVNT